MRHPARRCRRLDTGPADGSPSTRPGSSLLGKPGRDRFPGYGEGGAGTGPRAALVSLTGWCRPVTAACLPSTGTSVFAFGVPRPVAGSQPGAAGKPWIVGSPNASPWKVLSPVVMSWNRAL